MQSNLHRAIAQSTCAEQLAQTNLHGAHAQSACTEQLAQSPCAEQLAQSTCAKQLAQSRRRATCTDQLAQSTCAKRLRGATGAEHLRRATCSEHLRRATCKSTCAQQLAESNLRAAAWNNAACADHFREKSRGAVREESRIMRWSSHVTIHTEHRRAQTRSPQRCKKVSPRLDEHLWKNAFGPIVL